MQFILVMCRKYMQFPDQSSTGSSNNELGRIEIDFDDFIVQGLQRNWRRKVK